MFLFKEPPAIAGGFFIYLENLYLFTTMYNQFQNQ